ncbi:unnamed protein product [Lactuca saligna]|uniref:Uncharacterized protein n=1 Tax=Lactuca saligna TaxID=75948 RepID=A0AA35Z206_LACSI|nr:unnamed protein product [Lactuca saligna]
MNISESSVKLKKKKGLRKKHRLLYKVKSYCFLSGLSSVMLLIFELQNTRYSQLDMPITPKAFRFCASVKVSHAPITDSGVDHMLFSLYLKHMNLQYETWSLSKITGVKVTGAIETDSFPNAKFKVARGSTNQCFEFTLADLPYLNPNDWFTLYNMLKKNKEKYLSCFILSL